MNPVVGIVMGSDSDWPVMQAAAAALDEFAVPYEADVVSAPTVNVSAFSFSPTTTKSPFLIVPRRISSAIGSSRKRSTARRSGRAP